MLFLEKKTNAFGIFVFTLLIIVLIGFVDKITGSELSFSFFYLIPISLLSLYRGTKIVSIVIGSVLASLLWSFAEYSSREYSFILFLIWNSFVRLAIFTSIGLLIYYLKEKHKKLTLANNKLKALNEEKNRFIGITAHDLRNPISGIFTYSDLLIDDYKENTPVEVLRTINIIRTISKNTLVILNNLLDISKIESGKVELKIKPQDYILFVKQQISLNQMLANRKNIIFSFNSLEDSIIIDYDEHYLSQVLDNLLSNAIKYSNINAEIVINVSILNNQQIQTEVIDKGKGIPEEELQKLFNYFQTTSTRPTDGEKSTGLGLAIAKHIISLHNGEIGVKSIQNQGSNFYFLLPINKQ